MCRVQFKTSLRDGTSKYHPKYQSMLHSLWKRAFTFLRCDKVKIHKTNFFSEERLLHVEGGRSPHLPLWGLIHFKSNLENSKLTWSRKYKIWNFLSDPSPIIALSCQSVTKSLLLSRLDWCEPGVCEDHAKLLHGLLKVCKCCSMLWPIEPWQC